MKLYIVGAVSSGKSTLAKHISKITGISYNSLDEVVHEIDNSSRWGNRKRSIDVRDKLFHAILDKSDWIMEDTGRPCFEEGFLMADTIILLELPSTKRNIRIILRWIKQNLGLEKCTYKTGILMLKSMLRWSKEYDLGKDTLKLRLEPYRNKMTVIHSNKQIKQYLDKVHQLK